MQQIWPHLDEHDLDGLLLCLFAVVATCGVEFYTVCEPLDL